MDECSCSKEQTASSTESLKANCGHSGSSNDVDNLSFDNGSDDRSFDKFAKCASDASEPPRGPEHDRSSKRSFPSGYKSIGEVKMDEKGYEKPEDRKQTEDAETGGGVHDKMLKDDGYGSSNSSPHSAGVISNKSKTPNKNASISFPWPTKKDVQVEMDEKSVVESCVVVVKVPGTEDAVDDNRETWERRIDFLLSIIGFAVDLANVWRFPYLCYKNGGGAFLIPYTLMMVFGTVPLFFMELALGQYNRQGPISVWRICPLFKGIGFCAVLVAFYVSFYYNVIIAWALYFLMASATSDLPWMHCNNSWNTEFCWESAQAKSSTNVSLFANLGLNDSDLQSFEPNVLKNRFSPASEYFHRAVLEVQWSEGIHSMGYPKWQLVLCLLAVYAMLYLSLFKGVKSSGLVVWVTATMPYVVLTILLIRGLMLPGAFSGISYYLKPELSRLKDTQVWVDAAVQIFFSVGAGFGVHLSYASYNEFHNNCLRDCLITTGVNCFTSFFSGFVIFTYLGFMSHKHGIPISSVATDGPGLVFQVYPEAVSTLPGSNFWSMLFFFMLIMLGLDSAMGGLECIITGLMDEFRTFFKSIRVNREIFTLCAVTVSFSVAMVNVTPGGIYTFHLLDTYAAGISLLCSALFEAIAVSWFYGLDRFGDDIEAMIGIRPGVYWRICWKFLSPLFIIGVVMFGLFNQPTLQYEEYKYPSWAEGVGWTLSLSSILLIPLTAIVTLWTTKGTLKEAGSRFAPEGLDEVDTILLPIMGQFEIPETEFDWGEGARPRRSPCDGYDPKELDPTGFPVVSMLVGEAVRWNFSGWSFDGCLGRDPNSYSCRSRVKTPHPFFHLSARRGGIFGRIRGGCVLCNTLEDVGLSPSELPIQVPAGERHARRAAPGPLSYGGGRRH